jgi:hypothetical protein
MIASDSSPTNAKLHYRRRAAEAGRHPCRTCDARINASVEDCALAATADRKKRVFAGFRLISADNLAAMRTPKVAISEGVTDAMGWVSGTVIYPMDRIINATPNGRVGTMAASAGSAR